MLIASILLAAAGGWTGCSASLPEAPEVVGEDYPDGGIPVGVAWPSDWLEGFVGESEAVGGTIVGLRLEYVDDQWVWRVRSVDPGRDFLDDGITEPDRGREALIDASTLRLVQDQHVTLTDAELGQIGVSNYDAAQLSGEVYPSPRLVALERGMEDCDVVWRITTYDTETGTQSVTTVDALESSSDD